MAVNPNTPVLPTRATNNERGYILVDVQSADPNDPTPSGSSAKALGVFVAGVLNADGTISPAGGGSGGGAAVQQVVGNIASGSTDSGNPVKVGGVFNNPLPIVVSGNRVDFQVDNQGTLRARLVASAATGMDAIANTNLLCGLASSEATPTTARPLQTANWIFNGASWDRQRKSNIKSRIASTAAGGSPTNAKSTPGDLMQFWGQNGAAITYLQIYDKASAPVVGTDTPIATYPIPANTVFSQGIANGGLYCASGVSYAFTTDAAGTTGAAAAAVTSFSLFAA